MSGGIDDKSILSTNSNTTNEELHILNEIPQAKQPVSTHDRLWAELETLDRDAELARLIQQRHGFLGTEYAEKMAQLREMQIDLAREMTREEANIGLEYYHELWSVGDPDELYQRLYDDKHFELLNEHVARTSAKLDEIAAIIDASEMQD